jgi:hypothetical protein
MRNRLFLSAAVATLSLCLSQGYAQNAPHGQTGGETATQGESNRAQKPGEEKGAAQRSEQRAQDHKGQRDAREAEKPGQTGAADKNDEKHGAAAREEKKHGAAAKKEEDKRDAAAEDRDRTPTAQGGRETNETDRGGRMGRAGTEKEGRTGQAETDRAGQREQRGAADRAIGAGTRGAEAPRSATGRDTYGLGGREAERERAGRRDTQGGREAQSGREMQGGRDIQGGRGGRIQLSQRDQTRVRQIISQQNVQRISPNIFSPRIGAVLPPSVQFYPLPPAVISAYPQFDGYNFVMFGDDIAIIDPADREVVTVLDDSGTGVTFGYGYGDDEREGFRGGYDAREGRYGGGRDGRYGSAQREERFRGGRGRSEAYGYAPRVRLDTRQERALYRGVIDEARSNLRQVCVRVGERVPQSVDIEPVPRSIAAEAPDAERYDYFVLNDQVVLVDPDTRIVVDIIEEPK